MRWHCCIPMICSLLALLGCVSPTIRPQTPATNQFELELQQVILPGVCDFQGMLVDPVSFFRWLESESNRLAPFSVEFDLSIRQTDRLTDVETGVLKSYQYRVRKDDPVMLLPDAVKFYTGIMGLGYAFEERRIYIFSTSSVARDLDL